MNKVIEELISESSEEVWSTNPYNGSPLFDGYKTDPEQLVKLTIMRVLSLIVEEQYKVDQNWKCNDGIHISWKIKDLVKEK